jgi:L-fuconate dehydratase
MAGEGVRVVGMTVEDLRFPTSLTRAGSDAVHDPDYSAVYVTLTTDSQDVPEAHGLTFTIGRGNEVVAAAAWALRPLVVGHAVGELRRDLRAFWRSLVDDPQLRWLGPEKGVFHLATAAVVNTVWDLLARVAEKPLWKLLVDMSPGELVGAIDFRYVADALTPAEAVRLLEARASRREEREAQVLEQGVPAYTTSAGWLGYSDEEVARLAGEAVAEGWRALKIKVGPDVEQNLRRGRAVRAAIGPDVALMLDANQCWELAEACDQVAALRELDPYWIEEPTSPDDVLAFAELSRRFPELRFATGEHVHNRVMFKQFFQARAIQVCQPDVCRLAGVNETLAVLLLAANHDVPVCFHAGGVGLCEQAQHLAIFDLVRVAATTNGRLLEYVDELHEHFVDPVRVVGGSYEPPRAGGCGVTVTDSARVAFAFPSGSVWRARPQPVAVGG